MKLNIAVVGCGLIGREHAQLIKSASQCRLTAIVDPNAEAAQVAQMHGCQYFPDLTALLNQQPPDGIVIATPNHLHATQAQQCIEANIAVLIEKPVAHSLEAGQTLLKQVQHQTAKVLVGHHRAHSPFMRHAASLVSAGLLGNLVAIQGSALFYKPDDYFETSPWRTQSGGGPILINLIHEIGNLRHLCGEIVSVQAMSSHVHRGFDVEESCAMLFRFENGALGTFILSDVAASSRSWEQTSQENKHYATYPDEDCYIITGTQGSLSVPTMRLQRFNENSQRSWWQPMECTTLPLERQDPLKRQLDHFCDVITGHSAPLVSIQDGLQNLLVIDAIQTSITSQKAHQVAQLRA